MALSAALWTSNPSGSTRIYDAQMYLLFVDESGTAPPPDKTTKTPVFVLGGLIVPEATWADLRSDLDRAKRRFGVSGEIKWRFFAPSRGGKPNSLSHLDDHAKEDLRRALLFAINRQDSVRVIATVVDTAAAYRRVGVDNDDDLYHLAFKQLSERFQYFLQDVERDTGEAARGMIVCDNRNSHQDNRLKEFHQTLLAGGAQTSNYSNLIEGLFIAASHHSPGTQYADLVAGSIFRKEQRDDPRFYEQIEERVRRSGAGTIPGYGLIYIPKK